MSHRSPTNHGIGADDASKLIAMLYRLCWINGRIREAHDLGTAPGTDDDVVDERTLRSILNVHRLSLPPDKITEWGQTTEAAASVMREVPTSAAALDAWEMLTGFLSGWSDAVRALPETNDWDPDLPLVEPNAEGPAVVRYDLLANILSPKAVDVFGEAIDACLAFCDQAFAAETRSAEFEALARARVSELDDAIDLDAFTASFNLFRCSTRVIHDLESAVHRPAGLSMAGFRVLFSLWVVGDSQPRHIASLSGVSRAAVSGVVATLERDGLVTKSKDAADKRLVTVSLTDAGRTMVEDHYRAQNEREVTLFSGLNCDETKELGRLLGKLANQDR